MRTLAAASLRRPATTLALLIAVTAGLAAGLPRLRTEVGYRAFLGPDHPAIARLDAFAARFGGGLPFAAVWSCAESAGCDRALDARSLAMAHAVASAMAAVPGVAHVDGPATSPLLVVPAFGLPETRRLAPDGRPAADLPTLAAAAREDPTWVGQLVSADGLAAAIVVQLATSGGEEGARAVAALRAALAPHEAAGFAFHLVGGPVEFVVAGAELERSTARMVPAMVGLVGLVLLLLFRAPAPALATLASVGLTVVWTLGFLGWLGWPQNSLTQVLPPLVLVIGVCDAIHLLAAYASRLPREVPAGGSARARAMEEAAGVVGPPCLLTTLTTAVGFLSFQTSELASFARFGAVAAFAVTAALLVCFTLLPLLAVRLPSRWLATDPSGEVWLRQVGALVELGRRRATAVIATAAVAGVLGLLGMARLEVDARFEDLYGEESQVVRWVRSAAAFLREAETLEIGLALPDGVRASDPVALEAVARVEALASRPGLGRALSVRTPLDALHRALHGAPLATQASDLDPERTASLLRLIRREAPAFVAQFVDREGDGLRVSLQAGKVPQRALRDLLADVDAHLRAVLPAGYGATVTGPLATVAEMIDAIRRTQLASFAVAAGLILILIGLAFRSAPLAVMALVPTALPVVVTLGAMGWLGLALDVGSAMVAAVVLGLAVDDAIHLLDAYRRGRGRGEPPEAAMAAAVRSVGRALVTTSLALAVGFSALALAPWKSVASFGSVSAIAILGALISDLLVLPALVFRLRAVPPPRADASDSAAESDPRTVKRTSTTLSTERRKLLGSGRPHST